MAGAIEVLLSEKLGTHGVGCINKNRRNEQVGGGNPNSYDQVQDLLGPCMAHGQHFTAYGPMGTLHEGHCLSHGWDDGACPKLLPYLRLTAAHELWTVTVAECPVGCFKCFFEGQRHGYPVLQYLETQEPICPEDSFVDPCGFHLGAGLVVLLAVTGLAAGWVLT